MQPRNRADLIFFRARTCEILRGCVGCRVALVCLIYILFIYFNRLYIFIYSYTTQPKAQLYRNRYFLPVSVLNVIKYRGFILMNEKGIEKALKNSEVQAQTSEFSKTENSVAELPLFCDDASEPVSLSEAPQSQAKERGRGRPKGSSNRSTKEWVDYFLNSVKKSPLIFLGELYAKPTDDLAREIRIKREDALKLQISAASAVLPYVHQKQPVAVQVQTEELPTIQIFASQTLYNQFNNGSGEVKKEIIVDGIKSTTPEEISLKNNDLLQIENAESENKV